MADLLLTIADAAAASGRMDVLPDCPLNNATQVLNLLGQLPIVDALKKHLSSCINVYGDSFRLNKALTGYSTTPDQLRKVLTWACNGNRGFLTAAINQIRIPSFETHQFPFANASPKLEMAFAAHIETPHSSFGILFHGTSLDRLHATLCQGLKVLSDASLIGNGRSLGNGVYTADEPVTAWVYANARTPPMDLRARAGNRVPFPTIVSCLGANLRKRSLEQTSFISSPIRRRLW